MRKGDAGWAILIGSVMFGVFLFTPAYRLVPYQVFAWWPVSVALLLLGWGIGRLRPGPVPRLIAAVGMVWMTFFVVSLSALVVLLAGSLLQS